MRLICGLLNFDGIAVSEELLRRMAAQMDVPRLKPTLSIWRDGVVGLAVLDFSRDRAVSRGLADSGSSVMAADVRLDASAATGSDRDEGLQLLSHLEHSGKEGLAGVLGDFAFACWDRSNQRLVCGRDIFGIRPFAYAHRPGKFFAFASFARALHGSGLVPKTIDEKAVANRYAHIFRGDESLIAGIKCLPAAHVMEVSAQDVKLERYWHLDRAAVGTRKCSPDEAAQELRRLVNEAVACRLPRTGEVGAHLSGGLDSSAISVFAARRLREQGRRLHAYSFLDRPRNDIKLEDETEFVGAVLEQEADIDWTDARPVAGLPSPIGGMDCDKLFAPDDNKFEYDVCARAEEQGVGLILSGFGGDEAATFNGRGTFAELFLRGRWKTLTREIAAVGRERGWPFIRIAGREVVTFLLPSALSAFVRRMAGKQPEIAEMTERSLTRAARRSLGTPSGDGLGMAPDGRENRWRLINSAHITERTEVLAQVGAAHGLAFAFPLLDRRVVEFALSLPSEFFLRGGFRRRPFRDAMEGVLPDKVRLRHVKYMPFPGRLLDFADSKPDLLDQVAALEQNERVSRMIDFAEIRRQLAKFPTPERAREEMRGTENPEATSSMIAVVQAIRFAAYLEQHGRDQNLG